MKTLFTSFAGGFGRTIGRIFALLFLGFIALKLLSFFNIDVSKFVNILYMDVNAASSDNWTELLDLTDTHLYEGDMYSYIEFCNNYNQDNCAVAGRNVQTDYGWTGFTVNFNTNYLRVYNNHVILKTTKKYRLVIQQTGNTWTPVNSRYFITLNSVGGTNIYSSNTVYSNPDNTIFIEFTPINNNDILDMYIRTTTAPNYFWLASGTKNFSVVRLDELVSQSTDNSQEIIDNATQNTQDIINNQNQNTEDIKDTINDNLQSCRTSINMISPSGFVAGGIDANGQLTNTSANYRYNSYISVLPNTTYTFSLNTNATALRLYEYNSSYSFITPRIVSNNSSSVSLTTGSNTRYLKVVIYKDNLSLNTISSLEPQLQKGSHRTKYEPYGETVCYSKLDDTNNAINDLNDTLNDDNVSSDTGADFFNNFEDEDFGLSEIITIPLDTIEQLTQTACVPLVLPIPFTNNKTITLPCMTQVYEEHIPGIYNIWKVVSFGIIAYMIAIDIFKIVKGFKDPESDKVEVLDL